MEHKFHPAAEADQGYGGLVEGVHLAGYALERAFRKLEWLLQGDRWKSVGGGFADVNAFMDTVKLDSFKIIAAERKKIAERIKELQPEVSNRQIAKTVGVDPQTINNDLAEKSADGKKKPKKNKAAPKGDAEFSAPGRLGGAAAAATVAKAETKEERKAEKQEARIQREAALGAKQFAMPDKKHGVVYADPEWRFEVWSRETGLSRCADSHYPTSPLDEIKARDVPSISADDSVLFLWATVPMLPHALEVMQAWGFLYVTNFVWVKDKIGTGYWNRNQHELLLVGRKGDIPVPAPGTQWASVVYAPVREHSRKPDEFYGLIETYFPSLPKIELNCRGTPRDGWDAWGNEVEAAAATERLAVPR